jgi:hypothetical protein
MDSSIADSKIDNATGEILNAFKEIDSELKLLLSGSSNGTAKSTLSSFLNGGVLRLIDAITMHTKYMVNTETTYFMYTLGGNMFSMMAEWNIVKNIDKKQPKLIKKTDNALRKYVSTVHEIVTDLGFMTIRFPS